MVTPAGVPAVGARVRVTLSESISAWPSGAAVTSAVTDGSGKAAIAIGLGKVSVEASALAPVRSVGTAKLRIRDAGLHEVEVTLLDCGSLTGSVIDGYSGQPIEGAMVSASGFERLGWEPAVSDSAGRFSLEGWPLDCVASVIVRAPGYGEERARVAVGSDGAWKVPARFGMSASGGVEGPAFVELRMLPQKEISARVHLEGGGELQAELSAQGRYLVMDGMAHVERATTTGLGELVAQGLRSDITHSVRVSAPGFAPALLVAPPGPFVDLGDVTLSPEAFARGTLFDGTGVPLAGAPLELTVKVGPARAPVWETLDGANLDRDGFSGHPAMVQAVHTEMDGGFSIPIPATGTATLSLQLGLGRDIALAELEVDASRDIDLGPVECREGGGVVMFDLTSRLSTLGGKARELVIQDVRGVCRARYTLPGSGRFRGWWTDSEEVVSVVFLDGEGAVLLAEGPIPVSEIFL